MAEKDNKNKRKFAAVLLGVVGVAGLSVASASTLAVENNSEVALGESTVFAACDDAVKVGYDYAKNGGEWVITSVYLEGVNTACANKGVTVELHSASGVVGTAHVAAAAVTAPSGATAGTVTVGGLDQKVLVSTDLTKSVVVIG